MKLSDHFDSKEFRCHCFACGEPLVDPRLIVGLEQLRGILNAGITDPAKQHRITLTSGCRCPAYNLREHGQPNSQHLYDRGIGKLSKAADIFSATRSIRQVYAAALLVGAFHGIGLAPPVAADPAQGRQAHPGYLHVDVRDAVARAQWGYDESSRIVALASVLNRIGMEV